MVITKPKVATPSENHCDRPVLDLVENCMMTSSNMKWAAHVPINALTTWTTMYANAIAPLISRRIKKTMVTAGLKCAPETSPNTRIITTSMAPVATVLPSNAIASLPPESVSPMIPEPTTVANRNAVPIASALSLLASSVRAINFHPFRAFLRSM